MNWIKHDSKNLLYFLIAVLCILTIIILPVNAQVELRYADNETVTWQEAIDMYQWLDEQYEDARLLEIGLTDAGRPLHLFVIDRGRQFLPEQIRESGKTILFINNGIHPGEPCGVDASLKLASDLLSGQDSCAHYLDHTAIAIIPLFNVGGALNRGSYHRANQNGPEEHGFRGNARNLDLNRDFIKLDSKNTQSLRNFILITTTKLIETYIAGISDAAQKINLAKASWIVIINPIDKRAFTSWVIRRKFLR